MTRSANSQAFSSDLTERIAYTTRTFSRYPKLASLKVLFCCLIVSLGIATQDEAKAALQRHDGDVERAVNAIPGTYYSST